MKPTRIAITLLAALALAGSAFPARAHVSYTNRNFGNFTANGTEGTVSISNQTVSGNFGWADATDADLGDSHRLRAFRFSLLNPGQITLTVAGSIGLLPAFSIYSGLAHIAPEDADHDATLKSLEHLATLGAGPWDGCLSALGDWKIGNNATMSGNIVVPASLSSFTYIGHAADGTSANYGTNATGTVSGDGNADRFVTGTFNLAAGNYSVFIGGADYSSIAPGPFTSYGFVANLTVVPEPSVAALLAGCAAVFGAARRRRRP